MPTYQQNNGTTVIKGADGKIVTNIASGITTPPHAVTVPAAAPKNTGKDGTDAPPLVCEFKGKNGRAITSSRYYLLNPADKDQAQRMGPDAAIEAGLAFPSITTCQGALDKPALPAWAAGMAADAAEERLRELQNMDPVSMAETIDMLLEAHPGNRDGRSNIGVELRAAHRIKKDARAAEGTEVHALCESIAKGENPDVPEELAGYADAYLAFMEEYPDMKFDYTEATVAGGGAVDRNTTTGYMGTIDAIVTIAGKRYVMDLKTREDKGKPPVAYASVGQQLAAAACAEAIIYSDGRKDPMPEIDGGIAVVVDSAGRYTVSLFETGRDGANYDGFLAARRAWDWKRRSGKDPKPLAPGALSA